MSAGWGIFDEVGELVAGGFGSEAEARQELKAIGLSWHEAHVADVCDQHPEEERDLCESCLSGAVPYARGPGQ